MSKIDFVTVAFGSESNLLILQARSFATYVDPDCVGKVYLILDDEAPPDFVSFLEQKVLPEYGWPLRSRVKIISFEEIGSRKLTMRSGLGWYRQQALKIMASALVSQPFYVILDGKNHFIRPVSYGDFVAPNGKAYAQRADFLKAAQHMETFRLFNLDMDAHRFGPIWITPFVVKTDFARMLVESRENFYEWFMDHPKPVTEFSLITAYIHIHSNIDAEYEWFDGMLSGLWINNREHFEAIVNEARIEQRIKAFGVSYRLLGLPDGSCRLLAWEQYAIFKIWRDFGLIKDQSELDFLKVSPFALPMSFYN